MFRGSVLVIAENVDQLTHPCHSVDIVQSKPFMDSMQPNQIWLAHPTPLLPQAAMRKLTDRQRTLNRLLVDNLTTIPTNTNGVESGNPSIPSKWYALKALLLCLGDYTDCLPPR